MENNTDLNLRHYTTYSGVKLPLKLVAPLDESNVDGRITFFRGYYDANELLVRVEKVVYGEIEFEHRYEYDDNGKLILVEMVEGEEDSRILRL